MVDTIELGELLTNDGLSYGIVQPGHHNPAGIPIIRVSDLESNVIDRSSPLRVSPEIEEKYSRTRLKGGEILVSIVGTVGRVAVVPTSLAGWNVARAVAVMRPRDPADSAWIRYCLESPPAQRQMQLRKTDTVQATLNLRDLKRIEIPYPPKPERVRIAGVLGAIDDLINLGVAQVASLTTLVQAEFERRFGQRDLSLTIADVATVIDCLHSKKPECVLTGRVLLQLNNILDSGLLDLADTYLIEYDDYVRWTKNLETQQWDCVITNVGRVGAVARIPADVSAALGRNMTAVRPQQPNQDGAFLLAALRSHAVRQEIELRTDAGTILNALNVRSIPKLRLQNASISERESFQVFAAPLLTLADSLHDEFINLSRQRNELLPLLLSGQVQIKDLAA